MNLREFAIDMGWPLSTVAGEVRFAVDEMTGMGQEWPQRISNRRVLVGQMIGASRERQLIGPQQLQQLFHREQGRVVILQSPQDGRQPVRNFLAGKRQQADEFSILFCVCQRTVPPLRHWLRFDRDPGGKPDCPVLMS